MISDAQFRELAARVDPAQHRAMTADLISIEETAELFGVSIRTVRRWEAAGKMPKQYRDSHRLNYRRSELLDLLKNTEVD